MGTLTRALRGPPTQTVPFSRKGKRTLAFIRNRFPHRSEIVSVLGVAVFVCHSWSILGFLNKLSSFILRFTIAEISEIFAFMMAFALLEGLAVTGFLALLSVVLPSGWLKDGFALNGLVVIVVSMIASLGLQHFMEDDFPSLLLLLPSCLVPLLLMGFLIVFLHSRPKLQDFLSNLQDRVLIMLFIYVPLGLLSLVFVVVRYLS